MNSFIPREKLTAYQRWELAAFDEEEEAALPQDPEKTADEPSGTPAEDSGPEQAPIVLPTADEIERMHDEARQQGYAEGHAEGHLAGHEAGRAEGLEEALGITTRLTEILESLEMAVKEIEQQIADRLLATALEVANQVLRQSLKLKPDLLLPVVREALAALQFDSGAPALLTHPDDAALIRAQMGDQLAHKHWRIIEDASLTRGGCRVELGASEVDATLETRWKRVLESIGVKSDWLETSPPPPPSPPEK
jgi:flagellar assembly protein FliH